MQISLFKGKFRNFCIHCMLFNHFSIVGNHWELRFDISKYTLTFSVSYLAILSYFVSIFLCNGG